MPHKLLPFPCPGLEQLLLSLQAGIQQVLASPLCQAVLAELGTRGAWMPRQFQELWGF